MARLTSRRCSSRWPEWKLEPEEVAANPNPQRSSAPQSSNFTRRPDSRSCSASRRPKTFRRVKDADETSTHCEQMNRSLADRMFLDSLDETLRREPLTESRHPHCRGGRPDVTLAGVQRLERLVGVGVHADLAVDDREHRAVGVDHERGALRREMPKPRFTPNCSATMRSVSESSG